MMKAQVFDGISRDLGQTSTRRSLTRLLGGVAALGATVLVGREEADAKKSKKKKSCPPCKKRNKQGKCTNADGLSCENGGTCQRGSCVASPVPPLPPPPPPPPPPTCGTGGTCRVFVTSTTHQGNFGGLIVADAICQQRAQAANLPGTYKAWLSDSTNSPDTRFIKSPGPYHLVDGTKVADNYADLTDNSLDAVIDRTEFGQAVSGTVACWTFTDSDGTDFGGTERCGNWTSTSGVGHFGAAIFATHNWTNSNSHPCSNESRLYCFQQS